MHDDEFSSVAAHDSAAAIWAPLRPFIAAEARLATRAARKPWTASLYEFLRFGVKQAYACLFGGIAVALMLLTWKFYPAHAPLARYDFLFFCMLSVQAMLLALRLETWEEAKVILVYHLVGTAMELFKTATGSWIYPEPSLIRLGGVPLFSGFMYSCIGSYLCRVWRLFDFRFTNHPPRRWLIGLSMVIYLNFFLDHYGFDLRLVLFVVSALMIGPATVHFRVWRVHRSMPLLLGLLLVSLFIWLSENIGTFTRVWLYPQQAHGWAMVSPAKLGSWFLLLIISYTLVSLINRSTEMEVREEGAIAQQPEREAA
ncbi:DUF817 domain-containing protein [Bradyrhizobium sp. SZCCHNS2096]|uniref:DUF817 domain-containing protein n=1 Tax=Bradyrhizobium sp. SZCCHNS2096 TaxID=3057309 RepID=UPI0029161DFA|nr:DUF817 domain-containing protein [Bradyrhizobium sp. SZCCHNS2096]